MGRAYRENRARMLEALERSKEKAMEETPTTEPKRTSPAPGRILSKIRRPAAIPGARFIGCVEPEPEAAPEKPSDPVVVAPRRNRGPVVTLLPGPPMWYQDQGPGKRPLLLTAGCRLEHVDPAKLFRR